ncbi:unnamed protein product [Alopecurus aequalis]
MDMESNNACPRRCKAYEEDRLSALSDDLALSILGRVDLATASRTSVLSTRWRNLPWLLAELNLHVRDFLPTPRPDYPTDVTHWIDFYCRIPAQDIDQSMASMAKAARSFLCIKRSDTVARISLEMYLGDNYSHEIGPLVCNAIDSGMVKELDLTIADDKAPKSCTGVDMLQKARNLDGFLSTYPNMLTCLTRLQLYNLHFAGGDIHHILFDCCKQLQHLSLDHCDGGDSSVWQINAPNSSLRVLEIYYSCLKRLEVLCLPKLEKLHWEMWVHYEPPLCLGSVPSLKELCLLSDAKLEQPEFSLSQLLNGATEIHTLTLNFQGEKLWIQPEREQLRSAFNKLRKLSICGVYVEFDLLWTLNLLDAAPSVEIFDIQVFEHPCLKPYWLSVGAQRVQPSWKMPGFTSCSKWQLRELHIVNFSPLMAHHISFVRAVMNHAPNLKTVLLKEVEQCKDCDEMAAPPPRVGGMFPRDKAEQETIANQLRDNRAVSSAQIIFRSSVSTVVF